MTRRRRIGLTWAAGLAALALLVVVAVTPSGPTPLGSPWFDLQMVRIMARHHGNLPTRVEYVEVAQSQQLACMLQGSLPCEPVVLGAYAYRIVGAEISVVLEAPGQESELRDKLPNVIAYDRAAFARSQAWLASATRIAVTHEHFDHAEGLFRHPKLKALQGRSFITNAQLASKAAVESGVTEHVRAGFEPTALRGPEIIAPGIVAIPAPGHTPGSMWVYVALSEDRELLFVGDTAWMDSNIRDAEGTPRFMSWALASDGPVVAGQLKFLSELSERHPKLHMIAGHDRATHERLRVLGLLKKIDM